MRIIAGSARGRSFDTKEGLATRPTIARVKESVFGSLQFDIPQSNVLDLFAGSGGMGLEAASRGAAKVICNDNDAECVSIIKSNAEKLDLDGIISVWRFDYREAIERLKLSGERFDIVFLDAPYYENVAQDALELLFTQGLVKEGGVVVVEHDIGSPPKPKEGLMRVKRTRKFGRCGITMMICEDGL
ncbi:MAG: 16S rRNA (guanine(966)-N(2))-methyltransferase RsmD [Clostridia bacterium]|nr:16S rRNA (guanine(966)-N(2))-methyltransferase RsmD [Clostridia bacterium]